MDLKLAARLGATARRARTARRLTQADVAETVGVATEVYGRIERGRMLPSVGTLLRLCQALGVSSDELLGGTTRGSLPAAHEPRMSYDDRPVLRRLTRKLRALNDSELRQISLFVNAVDRGRSHRRR